LSHPRINSFYDVMANCDKPQEASGGNTCFIALYEHSHFHFDSEPAYLARGGSNVIAVDWGPLASHPCYFTAMYNMPQVATCTAHMLLGLATRYSLHLADVHAVGFSLGAHVAAQASNVLSVANGSRLGRITGTEKNVTCVVLIISLCCWMQ
jgi:pimeloyl-ACP methyl ester carboxylesterase